VIVEAAAALIPLISDEPKTQGVARISSLAGSLHSRECAELQSYQLIPRGSVIAPTEAQILPDETRTGRKVVSPARQRRLESPENAGPARLS
jgi:hypothetical protein